MKRIRAISSEYNLASSTIIQILQEEFPDRLYQVNQKLTPEEFEFIGHYFETNSYEKKISHHKKSIWLKFDDEDAFIFSDEEIRKCEADYVRYTQLADEIESLDLKVKQYWGLSVEEKNALLRMKFTEIEEIESRMEMYRTDQFLKLAERSRNDDSAHRDAYITAQWNID